MPSKGLVDRRRVAEALIAAARTHAHEMGVRLPSHLAEPSPDGGIPSPPLPPEVTGPELSRFQVELARTTASWCWGTTVPPRTIR